LISADDIADRLVERLANERGPLTERLLRETLTEAVREARRQPAAESGWCVEGRLPTKFGALDYVKGARLTKPEIPAVAIAALISAISVMPDPRVGQNVYFRCAGAIDDLGGLLELKVAVEPIFVA